MTRPKLAIRAIVCVLFFGLAGSPALAQIADETRFPSRPVRLISPFPPGGSNDILARVLAQKLGKRWPQQVVVDNRPGAAGIIGSELAARAAPDGHTIVMVATTHTQIPAIRRVPFDPVKSLPPVALVATGPSVLTVHPDTQAKSLVGLIALAKEKPDELRYASTGTGGFNHFTGELFNQMVGVKLLHIPYKGAGPALIDGIAGRVEVVFGSLVAALPHIRSGKLRALAVGSPNRAELLPDVPAVAESVPGYDANIWWGLLGPAGIPVPVLARLNAGINAVLRDPETARRFAAEGAEPAPSTPEAFGVIIVRDLERWAAVARQAGIKSE